jgi:CheY-like chemotaxis protein
MKKKKVLVIDDETGFTSLLKANLEETGAYEVWVENDGLKGEQAARWYQPHVILLDVIMPQRGGREVAERIRGQRGCENTPIVFLTAAMSRDEAQTGGPFVNGFPVLSKPATLEEITEAIDRSASP